MKTANEAQVEFLLTLARERAVPHLGQTPDEREKHLRSLLGDEISSTWASELIKSFKRYPVDAPTPQATPGVYETPDGEVYIVKPNRARTGVYALRLVEDRESGTFAREYAPGVVRRLTQEQRMPAHRAAEYHAVYGRCLACGRVITRADSLARGVGPVCAKYFA